MNLRKRFQVFEPIKKNSGLFSLFDRSAVGWMMILMGWIIPPTAAALSPEIVIKGVAGDVRDNVRHFLSLAEEACDTPPWRIRQLFARSDEEIRRAVRAFGYYHPNIRSNYRIGEKCWSARFEIRPGPRVHVEQMDVRILGEAADDPAFAILLEDLPLRKGAPLTHAKYQQIKQKINSLGAERGYFDSRFLVHELRVDTEKNLAAVRLHWESGPRYRFGRLRIEQTVLNPRFVQRFITVQEGEPYESSQLATLYQSLAGSDYFAQVEIRPRIPEAENLHVPVDIVLAPRKKHSYAFGIGADTDTGPRVSARYENRRLNRFGHRFLARIKLSPVLSEAGAEYRIPLAQPAKEQFSLRAGYKREDTTTTRSDTLTFGGRLSLLRESGWLETRFLDWAREDFEIAGESRSSTLLVPGIGWARSRADDKLYPKRGSSLNLQVRGAHEALLSDTSFGQMNAYGKWVRGLPWGGRFIGRSELGATAVTDFAFLPSSYRFFAGGDQSVRGYDFKELGPKNDEGDVVGGRYLAVFSAEYEHPLTQKWGLATFIDAGNAFDSFSEGLKIGIGVGVRWHTLIGPLRLDLAFPLDEAKDAFRIHFSMGPEL